MRQSATVLVTSLLLACAAPARADFVGLVAVREFPNQQTAVGIRDVFRVYAEFTDPSDRVDTWYGTQANPFVIQNVLANGSPGSGFFNVGGGASVNPLRPEVPGTPYDWDTWATIGETYEGEGGVPTHLSWSPVVFPPFIFGNSLTANGSIFLTSDQAPQGLGSFRVSGQDTATRVLLMQLTVLPGEHVQGQLSVGGRVFTDAGYVSFVSQSVGFSSIPAPASVLILSAAWLRPRRRCAACSLRSSVGGRVHRLPVRAIHQRHRDF